MQVALESSKGSNLWDVKLDLKSPGTLLLRSPEGVVHYLAFDSLTQIGAATHTHDESMTHIHQ